MSIAYKSNHIVELTAAILIENPPHKPFLDESVAGLPEEASRELDAYLNYCLDAGVSLEYLAECYNVIVQDTYLEQIYFMRHKKYRFSTYAEAAAAVYDDPDYMEKYMYGLALTLFFWPAHRRLKEFFVETLPIDRTGRYLEIGPGHGFFFMSAMKNAHFDAYTAVDISEKSVEMTRNIVESKYFGEYSGYTLKHADFLTSNFAEQPFDAVVMGEVLEHVEDPRRFLERIREITTSDSYIYVSTCMNAPAVDHLSLFESVDHLKTYVDAAGLRCDDECVVPYQGLTIEETQEKRLSMNIAMVLTHR